MSRIIFPTLRKLVLLLSIALVSFLQPAVAKDRSSISIAALVHLTGEYAQAGTAFQEGIAIALDEVNQSGGVKGVPLKVVFEDTQYNMKNVNTLSSKVLALNKVPLAMVSNYTEVMVAGPVFERAKTPLITLWDSSPEIEKLGKYVFGVGVWAPSTSEVAVDYALANLKAKTAISIATNGQWSLAVAESFNEQFRSRGGRILKNIVVNPGDTDFRSIATMIAKMNPDVIYAPLSDHQVPFWKQLSTSGYSGVRITSDILNKEFIAQIGSAAEGIYQTQVADPDTEAVKTMLKGYKAKYGKDCTQIFLTSLGYDALKIAAIALENAKDLSGESVAKELYKISGFKGAAGLTTINEHGSSMKNASMFIVRDAELVLVDD